MPDVRLSEQTKDQFIRLKRATGIKTWNILCRWALCVSLSESEPLVETPDGGDSAIEMRWDVFGGEFQHIYYALLAHECKERGLDVNDKNISRFARLHIQRGANILTNKNKVTSLEELIHLAV